jgi:tRNA(fMet)-specific endonuclease VapC
MAKNQLRVTGRLIPENDIWIAALACQYDLTVVSRDKHFGQVADLEVLVW